MREENMRKLKWYVLIFCILIAGAAYCKDMPKGATVAPAPEKAKAEYVGMDTCAMCHEKITKAFKRSEHSRIVAASKQKGQACEACHGAGSLHADAEGKANKRATIINPGRKPEACYQCHLDKKGEFSLQYHHPVPEGKMTCTDCHDPHGEDGVKPGTLSSLRGKNELCAKCHKDQTMVFVYEHEALREGCSTCHDVHGSINDKMLVERDANLCIKCHYQADFPNIGDYSSTTTGHGPNMQQGPCWSGGCHTAVHGSNYNDHLRI